MLGHVERFGVGYRHLKSSCRSPRCVTYLRSNCDTGDAPRVSKSEVVATAVMERVRAIGPVVALLLASCAHGPEATPSRSGHLVADDGVRLHYQVYGNGPPEIVVPLQYWNEPAFRDIGRNRTIAYYDPRGRRNSGAVKEASGYSIARDLLDLHLVLDALQARRPTLIGTSYYGALVARFAMLRPERVGRLVLVGALYPARTPHVNYNPPEAAARTDEAAVARLKELRETPSSERDPLAYCLAYWDVNGPLTVGDPAFHRRRSYPCDLANETPDNLSAWAAGIFASLGDWDWRSDAQSIRAPTLVIHGRRDLLVPLESSEEWARLIPNAHLVVLDGAGHIPWWEFEREMRRLVDDFAAERRGAERE